MQAVKQKAVKQRRAAATIAGALSPVLTGPDKSLSRAIAH
jgi:hypothetical protein